MFLMLDHRKCQPPVFSSTTYGGSFALYTTFLIARAPCGVAPIANSSKRLTCRTFINRYYRQVLRSGCIRTPGMKHSSPNIFEDERSRLWKLQPDLQLLGFQLLDRNATTLLCRSSTFRRCERAAIPLWNHGQFHLARST